jgi:hypothetical protein
VVFLKQLHEIFDLYADRTMRVGVVAAPVSVLPSYRTPQAVMRQIEIELAPLAGAFPEQTMALTAALWKEGYFETRLLAAILLGRIHPETPQLVARITEWVGQTRDRQLRAALLSASLLRLRRERPAQFLKLVAAWFDPATNKAWGDGIYALLPLIEDPEYENLPPVYEIVRPVLRSAPNNLQNELADLIKALYLASPVETIYFIKQVAASTSSQQTITLLRRIMTSMPANLQAALRDSLRRTG